MLKITSWLGFEAILGALKLGVHGCLHMYVLLFLQWYVQSACATQGTGLYEGLDWLSNELSKLP